MRCIEEHENNNLEHLGTTEAHPSFWLPRAAGRSYDDAALAPFSLQTSALDSFSFDAKTGLLDVGSGLSLRQILPRLARLGWTLPVIPGTGFLSIGGAIAGDVHGKSHHRVGSFSKHLESLTLLGPEGEQVLHQGDQLFSPTCGGLGLTGLVTSARIQCKALRSQTFLEKRRPFGNLFQGVEALMASTATQNAAWINTSSTQGAGFLHEFYPTSQSENLGLRSTSIHSDPQKSWSLFFTPPFSFVRPSSMLLMNHMISYMAKRQPERLRSQEEMHWPLDTLLHWNRAYGPRGFFQFQCLLDCTDANITLMQHLLAKFRPLGAGLAVLKVLGQEGCGWLSFPRPGLTLAVDLPVGSMQETAIRSANAIIHEREGRINLVKDALLDAQTFHCMYPRAKELLELRAALPKGWCPASLLSKRLGLNP
jgi:hypothetical protein